MPTFNRRYLRRTLGRDYIFDTKTGSLTAGGLAAGHFLDGRMADTSLSADGLFQRHTLRYIATENVTVPADYRVATFNAGSGAFYSAQTQATVGVAAAQYELHGLIDPADKDRMLDRAISHVWDRREYPLSVVNGLHDYSLPDDVGEIFDAYYFATPTGSLGRDRHDLTNFQIVVTGSGREIRIEPAIDGSVQLILSALVRATLGASDLATVNLPNEEWVLNGAAAYCYSRLARSAPGQETGEYKNKAKEFATAWRRGVRNVLPQVDRRVQLDEPF